MTKHKKKFEDLGLGEKASSGKIRTLNKDGTFNVHKKNIPFWERVSFFHALVTMTRLKFVGIVIFLYFFVNMLFASIYYSIGVEQLTGIERGGGLHDFFEAALYSTEELPFCELLNKFGVKCHFSPKENLDDKGGVITTSPIKIDFGAQIKAREIGIQI